MVLKPRAVPAPIWFSLLLAVEGVVMFCAALATVDPGILRILAVEWFRGGVPFMVSVLLQPTLAACMFAGAWFASTTVRTLAQAVRTRQRGLLARLRVSPYWQT